MQVEKSFGLSALGGRAKRLSVFFHVQITLNDEASEYSLGRPEFSVDMSETLSPDGLQAALQELEQSTLDDDWVRGPTAKSPTPFSSRKLVYDNENIVMPGR